MQNLPVGIIILIVVSVLIYLGAAQRVLDRLRLTDRAALVILGTLIVGSLIDIPFAIGNIAFAINVGGALVPIALAVYLLSRAGTGFEVARALVAALITAVVVFGIGSFLMTGLPEPAGRFAFADIIYIYPVVAAVIAYAVGRSRRGAWIAATLGVLLADVFHGALLATRGLTGLVHFGGAGVFDVVVVAGVLAVLLAEIAGELRERVQGGPRTKGRDPSLLVDLRTPGEDEGGRKDGE
ncbi:DUF1614 domain-containing protein [Candidatus Desulforudis audaxviator]|uniref:DUF1614 domain-containing protein n=1 Tax=Desulforudis audaxviator (strain MP104C) TaxID=477974 RepID=B1I3Y6_DESAP|nr:DUF1614 domain-containing protein [Candidatus Desulforudis audaxviator]ACA59688.1 protein of unknown function DUF1614 [Candidatus Desulforudis audaxviator MP104C]AZK59681.1 hypothetical protein Daudx_1131 [Candidatus Desulforudis audaxviator]